MEEDIYKYRILILRLIIFFKNKTTGHPKSCFQNLLGTKISTVIFDVKYEKGLSSIFVLMRNSNGEHIEDYIFY